MLDDSKAEQEYLALKFKFTGNGNKPNTIKGQAYLNANLLDLGKWSARHKAINSELGSPSIQGVVNLQAWADFSERKWQSALVKFDPSWLQWSLDNHQQKFEIKQGTLSWKHNATGQWHIQSQNFGLVSNDKVWPKFKVTANYQQGKFSALVAPIKVELLEPLLPLYPMLDEYTLSEWHGLSPHGTVGPIKLNYSPKNKLNIQSNLTQLSWKAYRGIPGSLAIDVGIELQDTILIAELPTQQYHIDFGDTFAQSLTFNGKPIEAEFDLSRQQLQVSHLELSNADIAIDAAAILDLNQQLSMSLAAKVNIKDVSKAHLYFPIKAMGHNLSDYLSSALKAGHIPQANVVWNGNFSDFPYQESQGIFQAGFNLQDGNFRFQPDWPAVSQLNLDALFQNERMDLWVKKGKLLHVKAEGAHVFIPTLNERAMLGVQAELQTKGEDATEVLQSSALSGSVGEVLNVVQVQGPIKGTLDLSIPLYKGGEENIRGQIEFVNNDVYISKPGIDLAKVTGKVGFHNDVVEGDGLTAKLFEQPLTLSFDTGPMHSGTSLSVSLDGQWNLDKLPPNLVNPMSKYYSGNTDWQGKLKMLLNDSGYSLQANIQSDLLGASLDLPDGFSKAVKQKRTLQAEFVSNNKNSTMGIKLGNQFEFWGQLDPGSGDRLKSYDVMVGRLFKPGDKLKTNNGHLNIDVNKTDLSDWLPIIDSFTEPSQQESNVQPQKSSVQPVSFFPPLNNLIVKANELNVFGQPLKQLSLTGKKVFNTWQLDGDSDAFKGQLDFYPDWEQQGIKITADKLHLFADKALTALDSQKNETENVNSIPAIEMLKNTEVLSVIPPIAVTADDFSFMGYKLGKLNFKGRKVGKDYQFETLELVTTTTKIAGSGTWFAQDNSATDATQLSVSIHSDNFERLAEQFKIDPGLRDSPLDTQLKLRWQGAPYDFHFSRLNGDVNFKLGKGHLSEVSDKGARLFFIVQLGFAAEKTITRFFRCLW